MQATTDAFTTQNKVLATMFTSMKKTGSKLLLALYIFHCNVWGSLAFVIQQSPARPSVQLNASPDQDRWSRVSPDVRSASRERMSFPRTQGGALQRRHRPEQRRNDNRGAPPPMRDDQYYRDRRPIARDTRPIMHDHVQGGSLRTYDNGGYYDRDSDMSVTLETEGRPLDALYEVWDGPNRTPTSIRAYSEDGALRPFHATVGNSPTMSVRNTAPMEFPLSSSLTETPRERTGARSGGRAVRSSGGGSISRGFSALRGEGEVIQGGSLKYYYFQDPSVESVHITLYSEGMPMRAVVELLQGPNSVRQIAEIDSEDGYNYPLECEVETPGHGSTIQIRNIGPLEFPLNAIVTPRHAY